MTHTENANRIASLIEDRLPELTADMIGKDLRPGHGGEQIVSGIQAHSLPSDPIKFRVIVGVARCVAAINALYSLGITARLIRPHLHTFIADGEECTVRISTYTLLFDLPANWTPS